MKKNIAYVVWGENILSKSLFEGQVVNTLINLSKNTNNSISLFAAIPIVSKKFAKNPVLSVKYIKEIKSKLSEHGIDFQYSFIPVLSTWFYSSFYNLPLYYIFNIMAFVRFLKRKNIDIIHCRSYHATIAATLYKKVFEKDCSIIFDTRGAFPEEGVYHGFIKSESISFRMWKAIERGLISCSDRVLNVSEVQSLGQVKSALCSNDSKFKVIRTSGYESNQSPLSRRKGICYVGVLGNKTWYCFEEIAKIYKEYAVRHPGEKLYIYTKSSIEEVGESLKKFGINDSEFIIGSFENKRQMCQLLSQHKYGLLPTKRGDTVEERLLVSILCGAKTPDYLTCGLPIIYLNGADEIKRICEKYDCGVRCINGAINFPDDSDYIRMSNNALEAFDKEFAPTVQMNQYMEIYNGLKQI